MFMSENIKPLYMYAGGKAKLIKHYKDVIPQPEKTHKYVEPFFGGGVLCGLIMLMETVGFIAISMM